MKKPNIIFLEPDTTMRNVIADAIDKYAVRFAASAADAIELADATTPDMVVMELSLAGHSGLEFLYEFRSYVDWRQVPVIVYTAQRIEPELLSSHDWKQFDIAHYLYKPHTSLRQLVDAIDTGVGTKQQ